MGCGQGGVMIFPPGGLDAGPDIGMHWGSGVQVGSCRVLCSYYSVFFPLRLTRPNCIFLGVSKLGRAYMLILLLGARFPRESTSLIDWVSLFSEPGVLKVKSLCIILIATECNLALKCK